MSRRKQTVVAAISAAILASSGLGAAQAATTSGDSARSGSQRPARGPERGPGSAEISSVASKLGVTSAQLKAALDAARPAKPDGSARRDRGADHAAALATALGADLAKVQALLEANRPERPASPSAGGQKPPAPDRTALVKALADGLGLEQSAVQTALDKVEAAHRAEHDKRDAAMYAAVAEKLEKSAADVKAAFEAVRLAHPSRR